MYARSCNSAGKLRNNFLLNGLLSLLIFIKERVFDTDENL